MRAIESVFTLATVVHDRSFPSSVYSSLTLGLYQYVSAIHTWTDTMDGDEQNPLHVPGHWDIRYEHSAGETASRFLRALRDEETVLGRKCPDCERVLAPPREFCEECFVDTDEWIELGPEGRIESFTIVPRKLGAGPEAPYALAYVQFDGADTAMVNEVHGIDLDDPEKAASNLSLGTRVKAMFESPEEREGRITDFHYEVL
jgi:uncharacterized OB-fold protein